MIATMKTVAILTLLMCWTRLFGVQDYLIKPHYLLNHSGLHTNERVLVAHYPEALDANSSQDDKNVFLYTQHFRIIYGISYKDSVVTKNLATKIAGYAEHVWEKEIEEFGFKAPRGTDSYYVDIYLGNKSAYNKASGSYVSISSYYAGYATAYDDATPYFVINPTISSDILKVTMAHEFFHTVQYAYGFDSVDDTIWDKNIWFLEATAVMMEDEVYDGVNDYINYLPYYLDATYRALEYHNSGIEYGKVIFAKYLREKYGLGFIKSLLEHYDLHESVLDDLKERIVADENESLAKSMQRFGLWLHDMPEHFEEGSLYPQVRSYSLDGGYAIGKYGLELYNRGATDYFTASNSLYLQEDFSGKSDLIQDVDSHGLIVLNRSATPLRTSFLTKNSVEGFLLHKGWNMMANPLDGNLSLREYFPKDAVVWVYRDGKYFAYTTNATLEASLDASMKIPDNMIFGGEAMWIFTKTPQTISFKKNLMVKRVPKLQKGWNFTTYATTALPCEDINASLFLWHFSKSTKEWQYCNKTDENLSLDYATFDTIQPTEGYFIYKGD